jgi:hypothetical protein
VRVSLDPTGLAHAIDNFDDYAAHVVHRLRRLHTARRDPGLAALLDQYGHLGCGAQPASPDLTLPLVIRLDGVDVELVSTIATFGAPREVILSELAIESLYPATAASRTARDDAIDRYRAGSPATHAAIP